MGPLEGLKIIEMAGIGPGPFAAMMLADMGAEVLRVDRPNARVLNPEKDVLNRGRRSIAVDLKHPDGVQTVLRLVEQADAIIEGFRPGVMERRPRLSTSFSGLSTRAFGRSTRSTSAPMSASIIAVNGPGPMPAISITLKPCSGPAMSLRLLIVSPSATPPT